MYNHIQNIIIEFLVWLNVEVLYSIFSIIENRTLQEPISSMCCKKIQVHFFVNWTKWRESGPNIVVYDLQTNHMSILDSLHYQFLISKFKSKLFNAFSSAYKLLIFNKSEIQIWTWVFFAAHRRTVVPNTKKMVINIDLLNYWSNRKMMFPKIEKRDLIFKKNVSVVTLF